MKSVTMHGIITNYAKTVMEVVRLPIIWTGVPTMEPPIFLFASGLSNTGIHRRVLGIFVAIAVLVMIHVLRAIVNNMQPVVPPVAVAPVCVPRVVAKRPARRVKMDILVHRILTAILVIQNVKADAVSHIITLTDVILVRV